MLDIPGEQRATIGDWYERMLSGLRTICIRGARHIELGCEGDDNPAILDALEQRLDELNKHLRSPFPDLRDENDVRRCMAECVELLVLSFGNQHMVPMLDIFRESVRTLHQRWEGIQPARLPDGRPVE